MRLLLSTLLLVTLPSWSNCSSVDNTATSSETKDEAFITALHRRNFDLWLERNDKPYGRHRVASENDSSNGSGDSSGDNLEEYERRLEIFIGTSEKVHRHNEAYERGYTTYAMTLLDSPFSDVTDDEFRSLYLMESQECSATRTSSSEIMSSSSLIEDLPKSIDWRTQGVLTPVKKQGHCGSCWTFSTTGTLEAHYCLQDPSLDCPKWTGLSEQQLLDCASAYDNHGCNGGLPSHAFEYIKNSQGIATESDYAYHGGEGPCNATSTAFRVADVYNVTEGDEEDLVRSVATVGPVSVAFDVSPSLKQYIHGVYDSFNATSNSSDCSTDPMKVNHAVVAVGYGLTDKSEPFYIIRNSWSSNWGMEGYFWFKRGENLCGISDCASYPILTTASSQTGGDVVGDGVITASLRG